MHDQVGSKEAIQLGFPNGASTKSQGLLETGLDIFINEQGGYTSVAVALSLLLSITMTFSLATGMWIQNRAADVQAVADASALAGANVVGSYTTLAKVVDAVVLTYGLVGLVVIGAGLVLSAIPGMGATGAQTVEAGTNILTSRQKFATSARQGLLKLEQTLPLAIVARSAAVVSENNSNSMTYYGCAIPYPAESKSKLSSLDEQIETAQLEQTSEQLQESSDRVKEFQDEAKAALREGWLADCGMYVETSAMCLYERTQSLAGLDSSSNPLYSSVSRWNFGAALSRARAYYRARFANEGYVGSSDNLKGDSAIRAYYYQYASSQIDKGSYIERPDGSVTINLPRLPTNSRELKATPLYKSYLFATTTKNGVRTIHSYEGCRGIRGSECSYSTMQDYDNYAGAKKICSSCQFSSISMGNVTSASTNIDNGFEYYWKRICDAAENYQKAANELAAAKEELQNLAQQGSRVLGEALSILATTRIELCPPGAYGCVSAVWRAGELTNPDKLINSFSTNISVGSGAAVSAAVLAPDNNIDSNNVLTRLFEAISYEMSGCEVGALGNLGSLWAGVLTCYGQAYESMSSGAQTILDKIEGIPGSSAASWLCGSISSLVEVAGFQPTDLRLMKPALTNSQNVLDKAGTTSAGSVRSLVELVGQSGNPSTFAHNLSLDLANKLEGREFTLAELTIPGTNVSVPVTVDVGELLGEVIGE